MANEKRLIDANALIKEACAEGAYGYVDAKQIAEAPTIDAVEVVRKPVKGYEGYYEVDQFGRVFGARANIVRPCNSKTRTAYGYKWMWETDFCSYGERKDGDGNAHLTDLKQAEKLYGCSKAAFDDCFGEEPDNA